MDLLLRDLRLALRRLARERGFTAVAVLTLALGLGANTAIFSIVDGVLLRPLTFLHPDELVSLDQSIPQFAQKYPFFPVNAASFSAWRRDSKLLAGIALLQPNSWVLTAAGQTPRQVSGAAVTAGMFPMLGVQPRLGRTFLASEDQPGRNHVVILTDVFWRSQFHADPGVIGRIVDLNGAPQQIVGVLPASLHFPHGAELGQFFGQASPEMQLFQPAGIDFAKAQNIGNFNYLAFARMKPGVLASRLRAELDVIEARMLAATHAPADIRVNTVVTSLRDQIVGNHALGLWLLLAAVGAILLIVCLNLANLLLVRVHGRGHELAIRMALGASRGRLLREIVAEGVVLALAGGGLGVLGAIIALRWLVHAAPAGIPRLDEVGVNGAVLAFSFLIAVICGVLFSLWPALRSARSDPQAALRASGRGASEHGRHLRARAWLVGAQAALAALLLIVAGLLTSSYLRLLGVDKGFQAGKVVEAELDWPGARAQRADFYRAVIEKLQGLPGVSAAGLIDVIPTQGSNDTDLFSRPHDTRPLVERPLATFDAVSPDYFAAMGIPMLRGRSFTDAEVAAPLLPAPKVGNRPPVAAVISATTAAKIWPGQNPLGQQFGQSEPEHQLFTVVGVAGDVRTMGLDQTPGLAAYLPYTYNVPGGVALVLRTGGAGDPTAALAPAIRQAVWSLKPDAAIPTISGLDGVIANSVAPRRFQLSLVLLFALCALLLAALGIYGVVAYSIERRGAEIGMRMVLGARSGHVVGMVMRQGLLPVVLGLAAGVAAALAAGRLLASLLFGVHATDPAVIASVTLALLAVGAIACALPARRATRIDPLAALRQ